MRGVRVACLVVILGLSNAAEADFMGFSRGGTMEVEIVSLDKENITVATPNGTANFARKEVLFCFFGSAEELRKWKTGEAVRPDRASKATAARKPRPQVKQKKPVAPSRRKPVGTPFQVSISGGVTLSIVEFLPDVPYSLKDVLGLGPGTVEHYMVWIMKYENATNEKVDMLIDYSLVTDTKAQLDPETALVLKGELEEDYKIKDEVGSSWQIFPGVVKYKILVFDQPPDEARGLKLYCKGYSWDPTPIIEYEKKWDTWRRIEEKKPTVIDRSRKRRPWRF